MPGRRITNPALVTTNYPEAVSNGAELLVDWDGLVWARPIPLSLVGNSWFQGSYDSATWDNFVKDDHNYLRVSTDGGTTWRIVELGASGDDHPPVTIGSPDGGLFISGDDTQILTLENVTTTNSGAMSPDEHIKLAALKFDYLDNIGGGFEIFKDYSDVDDDRTHNLRTLVAGANTTLSYVGDTIVINSNTSSTTGQANTGHNDGTLGVGVFDRMNGDILEFRHIHSAGDILTVTLDDVNNNIALEIVEANIDHDVLENFVPNEHIDHSSVSILTTEGITGGGDITTTRTLSLAFDELASITYDENDFIAVYDADTDTHYTITLASLPTGDSYTPVNINAGLGLSGGGLLDQDRTLRLSINSLPTVTFESTDYVAVYDTSGSTHAKVTLADIIGELAVSITAGDGMDFTTITSTGPITLGTPTSLTKTTTNSASGTTHEHIVDLSTWDLIDIGDVDGTPTDGYYLKWDSTTSTWITDNPAVGATTPGLPLNSIQFNSSNVFAGNAGLLYQPTTDRIHLTDANTATDAGIILGTSGLEASIISSGGDLSLTSTVLEFDLDRLDIGGTTTSSFVSIDDNSAYTSSIKVDTTTTIFDLRRTGALYLPELASGTTSNVLYFDSTTGLITYGAGGGSGTSQTLLADALSGLMVNGGSTSSAAIIELDQNDNKLTTATPEITDYIGFWDVSGSLQSKTLIGDLPGWDLYVNSSFKESINPGQDVNFVAGTGISLAYNNLTNSLTINGSSGASLDLYTQDVLREESISILNITSPNIGINYSSPGEVILSYEGGSPKHTHLPDAFISYNNSLYKYDISEGTAEKVLNAPTSDWDTMRSQGDGQYIWTGYSTTLYRYDIVNDTTDSVVAAISNIRQILVASDGVYVISNSGVWHVTKDTMVSTFYGDSHTEENSIGMVEVEDPISLIKYIFTYDAAEKRFYYKEIKSTYSGLDNDDWSPSITLSGGSGHVYAKIIKGGLGDSKIGILDPDNRTYLWNSINTLIGNTSTVSADDTLITYLIPSGHEFNPGALSEDAIRPLDLSMPLFGGTYPVSYIAAQSVAGLGYSSTTSASDRGIYVAEGNATPFTSNYTYEQAVNDYVYSLHADPIDDGDSGVNVLVGGKGKVYFHHSSEDPKQFQYKDVQEVSSNRLFLTPVEADITFVYFSNTDTGGGVDPNTGDTFTGIDLHVNSTLVQEEIPKIDIIAGTGISVAYSGDSGVTISTTEAVTTVEDIAFVFSDVTGESQTYTLDLLASYAYNIVSIVLYSDSSVGFDLKVNSSTVLSNTSTSTTTIFTVDEDISENDIVELTLGTSSVTEIKGKLRIQRL